MLTACQAGVEMVALKQTLPDWMYRWKAIPDNHTMLLRNIVAVDDDGEVVKVISRLIWKQSAEVIVSEHNRLWAAHQAAKLHEELPTP